ncbi:MAG: PID-CTERM protein-sorting domain-containing protein [Lutibacter sp.]
MNKKRIYPFLLSLCFMLISVVAYSKKPPPTPPKNASMNTMNTPPGPVGLPIDGGLSLLLISGVAYGVYELRRKK